MLKYIRIILEKLGIDGAVFYTSLNKIIQAIGGVITIFFIAKFLTGFEQGFYYTFGSVLSIQVFFELGLNGIITQYVAHEVSYLTWDSKKQLKGSQVHLSRLSSLLHFAVKWYLLFAGLLLFLLLISGFIFFNKYDKSNGEVEWIIPWILLSFSTTLAFLLNPLLAFLEGIGKVKQVAQIRLSQQIITIITIWFLLFSGAKLYSSGISCILGLIMVFILLFFGNKRRMLFNIWNSLGGERINYVKEIFPYQWKIGLSWISGYFSFQLFNPILFATEGATIAGQMGMTLTALSGISSLSLSWMSTKVPLYSGLIEQKKYKELDNRFNKTLKQSSLINVLALFSLLVFIYLLRYLELPLGKRFLPYVPLIMMILTIFMNQFVSSWAIYLRCHKKEPFLILSISIGISTCLSIFFMGKYYGVLGMTIGYCIINFCGFLWGNYIYRTKKNEWHNNNV